MISFSGCRGSRSSDGSENLLAGRRPISEEGVTFAKRVTDGSGAPQGDRIDTTRSAHFAVPNASLTYDLGRNQLIRAVWVQAAQNDSYDISISEDGRNFKQIWNVPRDIMPGLRARFTANLNANGRYLRLTKVGGDQFSAVSEFQAFSYAPLGLPPTVPEAPGTPLNDNVRHRTLLFGFAACLFLLLTRRGSPLWWKVALGGTVAAAAWQWFNALYELWPVGSQEVSMVRGVVAMVAAVAIAREFLYPRRWPAHPGITLGTLGVCGVIGIAAFYNLCQPQFYDQQRQAWTPVHHLDLRQYYPVAKYFKELGYTRLYEADVAAYAEDIGASLDSLGDLELRELYTHRIDHVRDRREQIEATRQRFTPERWEAYKKDARYFRQIMGTHDYLQTMFDMGGNATPVWIGIAHILFNAFPASNTSFLITGLLDPLLILIAFAAIGRTFGLRTMFVSMVLFGANDFIMYGTNWGGATLRHDWMAYLALGACALKAKRYALGGVLFGLSTSIRAFPALAIIGVTFPLLWFIGERYREQRKLVSFAELKREYAGSVRAIIAFAVTIAVLLSVTSVWFSPRAWAEWAVKVGVLSAGAHANHISLRSLIAGWGGEQYLMMVNRLPIFIAGIIFYVGLVIVACRGKRPEQAAMMTLILIPVIFYPANYYIHFIFLLPLLAVEHRRAKGAAPSSEPLVDRPGVWTWLILLLLCTAQYYEVEISDFGHHFHMATVLLFIALTLLLLTTIRSDYAAFWDAPEAALAPAPEAAEGVARAEPGTPEPEPAVAEQRA